MNTTVANETSNQVQSFFDANALRTFKGQAEEYRRSLNAYKQKCYFANHSDTNWAVDKYYDSTKFNEYENWLRQGTNGGELFEKIKVFKLGGGSVTGYYNAYGSDDDILSKLSKDENASLVSSYIEKETQRRDQELKAQAELDRQDFGKVANNWKVGGLVATGLRLGAIASNKLSAESYNLLNPNNSGAAKFMSYAVPAAIGVALGGPVGAMGALAVLGIMKIGTGENKLGEMFSILAASSVSGAAKVMEFGFIGVEKTVDFASKLAKRRNAATEDSTVAPTSSNLKI